MWDASYVKHGRWISEAAANGGLNDGFTNQVSDVRLVDGR
jgi:hypothetical protein